MEECSKKFVIKPSTSLTKGDKGDKGDPGLDATFSFPISTDNVDYRGSVLTDVIDDLLYLALSIIGFSAAPSVFEKGQVLTSIQLSWSYNKAVDAQSITGTNVVPPTLLVSDRTKLVTLSSVASDTVITLTADDVSSDANPAKQAQLTLSFLNKLYYGKHVTGTIDSAFVLALTGELKSNKTKSFTANTGAGEYIWFACPVAYGFPSFKTNGFDGGFNAPTTISLTNASTHVEDYYVFRSTNENLGVTNVDVL
jgi:hypothetical protein